MKKFLNFLSYHNAVPIALSIMLLGAGGTYAATNPEAIIAATSTVQSIDNTFIVNTDLSQWDYRVQVMGVTQDENMYYVAYQYETLQLQNDVWQKVIVLGQMKASKKETDQSGVDLGIFVAKELAQTIEREKKVLLAAQDIEKKKGEMLRTVATTYSGLVGKFLDDTEETFPGYVPVVDPITDDEANALANAAAAAQAEEIERTMNVALANVPTADQITQMVDAQVKALLKGTVASPTPNEPPSSGGPTLVVNGANPAQLIVGDVYSDLGATITGPGPNTNFTIHALVNGEEMSIVLLNTSAPGEHTITYRATDDEGRTGEATRTVIVSAVGTPQDPPPETPPEETPPPAEEPPAETPPAEDPPAETPPAEEPPAETPPAEEPPTETPPAEEPPAETPPAETPPPETPPTP